MLYCTVCVALSEILNVLTLKPFRVFCCKLLHDRNRASWACGWKECFRLIRTIRHAQWSCRVNKTATGYEKIQYVPYLQYSSLVGLTSLKHKAFAARSARTKAPSTSGSKTHGTDLVNLMIRGICMIQTPDFRR